mmetsp:Transcript_29305/g.74656  ORF Transcript_29305/g.74656 Transcript_29305/m.74656 type:complete len:204 (-) Transcript_29305:20-631(-)
MGLRFSSASASYFPGPVDTTVPLSGRSLAVSGSSTPPMVTSAVSSTLMSTRSDMGFMLGMSSACAFWRGMMPMTSSSRMRIKSCSLSLMSVYMNPNLEYSTVSPVFRMKGRVSPLTRPSPSSTTSPDVGFLTADVGSKMPPRVLVSSSATFTSTRSPRGLILAKPSGILTASALTFSLERDTRAEVNGAGRRARIALMLAAPN